MYHRPAVAESRFPSQQLLNICHSYLSGNIVSAGIVQCAVFGQGNFQTVGFGGLEVACWHLVPKFAGSNPAEAVGFLRAKKILSTPSFGGEVKPSVTCRRFGACKRSLELRGSRILDEICRNTSRPRRVPPSAARGLSRRWT